LARIDRAAEAAGETRSRFLAEAARSRMGELVPQDAMARHGGFAEGAARADIPKALKLRKRAGGGNPPLKGSEISRAKKRVRRLVR
jgi:hypothetical protein